MTRSRPKAKDRKRSSVVQLERTGCGIASVANLVGVDYRTAQRRAAQLGITAANPQLWSSIEPVRDLLTSFHWQTATRPTPFRSWTRLPM